MTGMKESFLAKARARWSPAVPEAGLDGYIAAWWHLFLSVPVVGVIAVLVVGLGVWSEGSSDDPNMASVAGIAIGLVAATSSWFVLYYRVKQAAGRALGLSTREARKLDVGSPELLQASLDRIRAHR